MRHLKNEVYRVRNRTHGLDIQQRNHRDSSCDQLDVKQNKPKNNETPNNCSTRADNPSEDPAPHEEYDTHEEPYRHSAYIANKNVQGDDRTCTKA